MNDTNPTLRPVSTSIGRSRWLVHESLISRLTVDISWQLTDKTDETDDALCDSLDGEADVGDPLDAAVLLARGQRRIQQAHVCHDDLKRDHENHGNMLESIEEIVNKTMESIYFLVWTTKPSSGSEPVCYLWSLINVTARRKKTLVRSCKFIDGFLMGSLPAYSQLDRFSQKVYACVETRQQRYMFAATKMRKLVAKWQIDLLLPEQKPPLIFARKVCVLNWAQARFVPCGQQNFVE